MIYGSEADPEMWTLCTARSAKGACYPRDCVSSRSSAPKYRLYRVSPKKAVHSTIRIFAAIQARPTGHGPHFFHNYSVVPSMHVGSVSRVLTTQLLHECCCKVDSGAEIHNWYVDMHGQDSRYRSYEDFVGTKV